MTFARFSVDVQHPADVLSAAFAASVPNVPIWATFLYAVLLLHVLDDLFAAILAEVDVDVGRFCPVRVEEALEQQVVLERADVAEASRYATIAPQPEPLAVQGMPLSRANGRSPRRSGSSWQSPSC
ncbi:MAG: hypothetical protein QM757_10150 [Paludibaculum sp.]